MKEGTELLKIFSLHLREILLKTSLEFAHLQEIRLRVGQPLSIRYKNHDYFIGMDGGLLMDKAKGFPVTASEIKETMEYISNYSFYAYEEEVRQGFITVSGGHRVGIAGKVVAEGGKIKTMKYISFINVRLAHQIKGCADKVMPYLIKEGNVLHTLIISPPCCGKTTLLRDIIRQISDGGKWGFPGANVGVVDERSELAACYMGVPQNDLGMRTDVLDCCPKAKGMLLMIRAMSPEVIAADEIGMEEDIQAIRYALLCGSRLLCSVHGASLEEIKQKPMLGDLVRSGVFQRYLVLSNCGQVGNLEGIYDSNGGVLSCY